MALTTAIKNGINLALAPLGLKLDTLTAERRELSRLRDLERGGYFDSAVFPLPDSFSDMDPGPVLAEVGRHASRFEDLTREDRNPVAYTFANTFFSSPDAEVLYSLTRAFEPATVVEIGSGHSTRLFRLAISDGAFESRLVSVDPSPRRAIAGIADIVHSQSVESMTDMSLFTSLKSGDILSIDSSHELRAGNDLLFLYFKVVPNLAPGVIVHIHDIFLPFDYQPAWVVEERREYSEQYIVQSMLQTSQSYETLWAGFYLQRTMEDFPRFFPHAGARNAQSLWIRKLH